MMTDNTIDHLDATGWEGLVLAKYADDLLPMSERVKAGYIDPLAEPIMAETEPGWQVLETGSGWGSLSAMLAHRGRQVTLMDWGSTIVAKGQDLLRLCDVSSPQGVCADLFAPLPFADNSFDCVWSSGVLEHFQLSEQLAILQESTRVARRAVISLVPNRLSLAYRYGKRYMEGHHIWEFGYESPMSSQKKLFNEAGLREVHETTIQASRSAWFLQQVPRHYRFAQIWSHLSNRAPHLMEKWLKQGYMLVTVGYK